MGYKYAGGPDYTGEMTDWGDFKSKWYVTTVH